MKKAFTLVELLVVIAMIVIITGAMTTSFSSSRERARIQKATSEVKIISQAILAYEQWNSENTLKPMEDQDADSGSLDFLLGSGTSKSGDRIPTLLMAQLRGGGKMLDPWGHPYKITIRQGSIPSIDTLSLLTGYCLPNYYRLGAEERQ